MRLHQFGKRVLVFDKASAGIEAIGKHFGDDLFFFHIHISGNILLFSAYVINQRGVG